LSITCVSCAASPLVDTGDTSYLGGQRTCLPLQTAIRKYFHNEYQLSRAAMHFSSIELAGTQHAGTALPDLPPGMGVAQAALARQSGAWSMCNAEGWYT
jgi:hypothetical protein